ncbi:MAG: hypothetical protein HYZ42_10805 [Bacteroidetes bacterium]|nr:hypothetical protein [Bacteroidota bacterium]
MSHEPLKKTEIFQVTSIGPYLLLPSLGLALVGLVILFKTNRIDEKPNPLKIRNGVLLFGQVFVLGIILVIVNSANDERARIKLNSFLNEQNLVVAFNNRILDSTKSKQIIDILKTIQKIDAHHSHPTGRIPVKITSKKDTVV